jgi:uncharacterized protein (TIGR03437 family)
MGDILLECSSGTPGSAIQGNLTVFLPVPVSNRLTGDNTLDAMLAIDTGSGFQASVAAARHSSQGIAFNGINFTVPASGRVRILISNIRAAVNQYGFAQRPINAQLAFSALSLSLDTAPLTVATADRGLLASYAARGIPCVGSKLPATITLTSLLAERTLYSPSRVTEGFPSAFQPRQPTATNGTRIISRYTNLPAGARVFVPDVVAGSGDLVAARVLYTDPNGAGGVPVTPGPASTDSVTEVPHVNGTGLAVYEIVSANPSVRESFLFPTFIGLTQTGSQVAIANQEVFLGPISTVGVADATAPVPRFVPTAPVSDCDVAGDCEDGFTPKLDVRSDEPLVFYGISGGVAFKPGYVVVRNDNSRNSDLVWTATVTYKSGSGWLRIDQQSGINNARIRLDVSLMNLAPGTYEATITVDGGPFAGTKSLPVIAYVGALPEPPKPPAPPTPPPPAITVSSVGNLASPWPGPLVPGSLAVIKGDKLAGAKVAVTFDSVASTVLSSTNSQISLLVPPELAGKTSAQMVITADANSSAPQAVSLAPISPAIFENGILNPNSTANSPANPAPVGSTIALFVTGLLPVNGQATVTAKIHDREDLLPVFAGPAPTLNGVQQVNVGIPEDLPAMITEVLVCAATPGVQKVCSLPVKLTLSAPSE